MFNAGPVVAVKSFIMVSAVCLIVATRVFAQDPLLPEIAAKIDSSRGKEMTLVLRLSYVDRIFHRIVFYDRKNHYIEFDISPDVMKKLDAADFLNLHEGLEYRVSMIIRDRDATGGLIAELKGFKPFLFEKLP